MYAAYGVRGNPMTIQKYLELFRVLGISFYKAEGDRHCLPIKKLLQNADCSAAHQSSLARNHSPKTRRSTCHS